MSQKEDIKHEHMDDLLKFIYEIVPASKLPER